MNVADSENPNGPHSKYSYPQIAQEATLTLHSLILNEIREKTAIPFDQFMATALYHPKLGYYTRGAQNVGREGDFFTSVSTGKCFGMIIAHRIIAHWKEIQSPTNLHIIEIGANNGQLALDILDTIQTLAPNLHNALTYHIIEPLPSMVSEQQNTLAAHKNQLQHHQSLQELANAKLNAIILSNELIDAFPVKLIKKQNNTWQEIVVRSENETLTLDTQELSTPDLKNFTQTLPKNLPENYTTEYRPNLDKLTTELAATLQEGLIITIDYGYTHSAFYAPQRTTGTLRTFHQHKAGENPLDHIGQQDITAHVDFTQLATHLINAGFTISDFTQQATYLTKQATPWLTSLNSPPTTEQTKLIRQFQTLTHPTMLGKQFLVLEAKFPKTTQNQNLLNLLEIK